MALLRFARRLYSVDLPTLGLPTITTRKAFSLAGALRGDDILASNRAPSVVSSGANDRIGRRVFAVRACVRSAARGAANCFRVTRAVNGFPVTDDNGIADDIRDW